MRRRPNIDFWISLKNIQVKKEKEEREGREFKRDLRKGFCLAYHETAGRARRAAADEMARILDLRTGRSVVSDAGRAERFPDAGTFAGCFPE
jgi:hypothetical protein